jgi:pyruvate dehydrogenase E2 component (dihydrolipoamide acetyltransferase)
MAIEVILPVLGETVTAGTIVEWFKKEGDPVKRGDLLFSVESDKAVLEVEAPGDGFLRKILVPSGEKVLVLTVVALITRTADEPLPAASLPTPASETPRTSAAGPVAETGGTQGVPEAIPGRVFASPRARKTAQEKGVDLSQVTASGPQGRIEERDVLAFLAAQPKVTPVAARTAERLGVDLTRVRGSGLGGQITRADVEAAAMPAPDTLPPATQPVTPGVRQVATASAQFQPPSAVRGEERESLPLTGLRRIISERMSASHLATARVTLVTEADATAFVEAREVLKADVAEAWGFAPGYSDLLGVIVARALHEFPYMNARLDAGGQGIERLPFVNLGMAVDTERGLLVPVIRDADQRGLRSLGSEFRTLVARARTAKSTPEDLSGGTFTITNLGMYDVDAFTPIINLPETAILGAGRIQPKAVVRGTEIVARQMWTLSLAFDHRLVDGAPAARFLQRIKQLIETPYLLLG